MAKNKNANKSENKPRVSKWDRWVAEGKAEHFFVPCTLDNAVARAKAQK